MYTNNWAQNISAREIPGATELPAPNTPTPFHLPNLAVDRFVVIGFAGDQPKGFVAYVQCRTRSYEGFDAKGISLGRFRPNGRDPCRRGGAFVSARPNGTDIDAEKCSTDYKTAPHRSAPTLGVTVDAKGACWLRPTGPDGVLITVDEHGVPARGGRP
jgi:hypothetical protein